MALFSKPPAKKPEVAAKPAAKPGHESGGSRAPVSARDVAVQAQAQGRRGTPERPRAEPVGDFTMTGASLIEWSPGRTSIEVAAQSNPGLCAVLENAALLYASGQAHPARDLLEQGVQADAEAKNSPLAWLALFDLLERANDRAGFDKLSLLYVVQFERSPPAWEEGVKPAAAPEIKSAGGYAVLTGKLTAATAPQIESLRKAMAKGGTQTRLDLSQVAGFDDAGAQLLAAALAEARKRNSGLKLERADKVRKALDILVRRGREAGEGPWLLSLELLQLDHNQEAFDERAIEYAIAFEQSPPSWEPPPAPKGDAAAPAADDTSEEAPAQATSSGSIAWTGVMAGPSAPVIGKIGEQAFAHSVVTIDMTELERIDFVCAGALLNAINRVESQRKAVQIVGATPIIRALLLLIGISPRHFLKKPQ
jgi:anti-anti-sigma regulatory factor